MTRPLSEVLGDIDLNDLIVGRDGRVTSQSPEVRQKLEDLKDSKGITPSFLDKNAKQCNCTNAC